MIDKESIRLLGSMKDHVRFVDIAIRETAKTIFAWLDGDEETMKEAVSRVAQAEKDANKIKLKLMNRIAEAQSSLNRTDFLRLTLKMDLIPDFIEGAAVRITKVQGTVSDELNQKIRDLCEAIVEMSSTFKKTVKSLLDSPKKTEKYCDMIDECEEKIDSIYRTLEADLYNSDLETKKMLQIKNVMYHIEEAGDLCHETADHIRIIIATF